MVVGYQIYQKLLLFNNEASKRKSTLTIEQRQSLNLNACLRANNHKVRSSDDNSDTSTSTTASTARRTL